MRAFAYARPVTMADALALLDEHGSDARLLCGGTDLVVGLRKGTIRPRVVIDLKRVAELRPGIEDTGSSLVVGATGVLTDLIEDPRVRRHFPALVDAALVVGSVQIRNRATLAGNICNASPAADTAPALLVYGARVNLVGTGGRRTIPYDDFVTGPRQTVLGPGELVASIELPLPAEPLGAAFARLTRRRGVDLATISLCCSVSASGVTRIAYGAVGPRPFLVTDDSGVLADRAARENAKEEILARFIAQASPISDVRASREYREAMLAVLSRRALATASDRLAAV
jgi:CO/xanthine dehydrogenase FAD-binding subunit